MIMPVAALASVCLSMALMGWERPIYSPGRSTWSPGGVFSSYPEDGTYGCCEEEGCDCGNIFMPCPMCPGSVDLTHAWVIKKVFYRTIWTIMGAKRGFDQLYLNTTVWICVLIITNGTLFMYGHMWRWGRDTRMSVGCQKDCDMVLIMEEWKSKHRIELEQMAKTIEFMQRKYRRQTDILEKKEYTVDLLGAGVRQLYRRGSECRNAREMKRYGFEMPSQDFEWN